MLRTVKALPDAIARKGEGAAAMWGPDGGDLFEQAWHNLFLCLVCSVLILVCLNNAGSASEHLAASKRTAQYVYQDSSIMYCTTATHLNYRYAFLGF